MGTWDTFTDGVRATLSDHGLLTPGLRWVLGISGGPDSTILAHVMPAIEQRERLGWTFHVAHLHHGLRGAEADGDADFVKDLAERLGLTYHYDQVDIPAQLRDAGGGNTEEFARRNRYEFLERVAFKTGCDCVAVGHHADDNAETVFHRVCRGTGLRGLGGMSEVRAIQPGSRVRLVRPLLRARRSTIEGLCSERTLRPRFDSMNESLDFTRGKLRKQIFPLLRDQMNPNIAEALLRLSEQARRMGQYLEDAASRTFESLVVAEEPRHLVLNTHGLLAKQRIIQAEVVRRAVSLVLGREQDLSFVNIEHVLQLAEERSSGKQVHLPGPVLVQKIYGRLDLRPLEDREPDAGIEPVHVRYPGETALPAIAMELSAEIRNVDPTIIEALRSHTHPYEEWLDLDRLTPPLIVRGRKDGDRFHPLGAHGSKTLSDFLIGEKVDPPTRAKTGVLCDQHGPVWIMPLRIDERVKLRPTTRRALRLTLQPMNGPRKDAH